MYRLIAYAQDGVQRFPLGGSEFLVGSVPECDIYLPYTGVAQQHARIWREDDGLRIQDLGSRRGVVLNGERVREAPLDLLDEIRLGNITLLLEDAAAEAERHAGAVLEDVPAPADPTITAESMTAHLSAVSNWVLADTESRTTLESLVRRVLVDFGGGIWFLFHGAVDNAGIKFVVATEADWLARGEHLLEQVKRHRESSADSRETGSFTGDLEGGAWIFYRFVTAMDRSYFLLGAFPQFQSDWSPVAGLGTLGDLLILGLVHHVGRYEPILPGQGGQADLTLAPGLILGESEIMTQVVGRLRAVADQPIHVLLRGETGSGRELLARTLHLSSPQRQGPFVVVSCGGASPQQVEADLFGAEITGKDGPVRREGKIQLADGGTLLLQDLEQLPLELQSRLVRFLRSGEIDGPGGRVQKVDVRIIAGSRGPLEPFVARDLFRVDLAYRLSQFAIDVPALRERRDDVPLLIQWYINRFCHETGKRVQGITVKTMSALMTYEFPGNLPELENIARQMVYLCPNGQPMDVNLLPGEIRISNVRTAGRIDAASELELDRLVSSTEQAAIREALRRTQGNKSQAAKLLGLSRNGLAMKMERYGLQ